MLQRHADPKIAALGQRIGRSTRRMSALIDDVLDFARGRLGGGISTPLEEGDIDAILSGVVAELRDAHPDRLVEFDCEVQRKVTFDKARIRLTERPLAPDSSKGGLLRTGWSTSRNSRCADSGP